jgi:enamine deaminase RidA (YjgF/YER057c/UK114 family)
MTRLVIRFGCLFGLLGLSVAGGQAPLKPITVRGAASQTNALGSAAIDAGDYVYISGQGPNRVDGSMPADFSGQVRQSLDNIRSIVEAAGLTMENVVYVHVYLDDASHYETLDKVFAEYFPKSPPARGILGVAANPDSSVQISATAVRDLAGKRAINLPHFKASQAFSAGILTHDRLFISSMFGIDPATGKIPPGPEQQVDLALDGLKAVTETAGLSLANMVFVNPYLTEEIPHKVMNERYARRFEFGNTPGRATIDATSLPEGANIAFTGVALRDLSQRRAIRPKNMPPSPTASPCVFAGDTLYCSAKSGFIPGPNGGVFTPSLPDQTRQTMRNLLDNLEEADMKFDQVVSTVIYLDKVSEMPEFARVYKRYFGSVPPAQTTVQQVNPVKRTSDDEGHFPEIEQVSLIAVRTRPKQ